LTKMNQKAVLISGYFFPKWWNLIQSGHTGWEGGEREGLTLIAKILSFEQCLSTRFFNILGSDAFCFSFMQSITSFLNSGGDSNHWSFVIRDQGCQILLGPKYQNGGKIDQISTN
jgi:hypothetical protein